MIPLKIQHTNTKYKNKTLGSYVDGKIKLEVRGKKLKSKRKLCASPRG